MVVVDTVICVTAQLAETVPIYIFLLAGLYLLRVNLSRVVVRPGLGCTVVAPGLRLVSSMSGLVVLVGMSAGLSLT